MPREFEKFMDQLKVTNFSLSDFVDFPKVTANVDAIALKLHALNFLLGKKDIGDAVKLLWDENPKVFSILSILIAVRDSQEKKIIDDDGEILTLNDFFKSPEQVTDFLSLTGLSKIFQDRRITNLVDYVFGIEVGLDTNARKNRGGTIMENRVANIFLKNGLVFESQVSYSAFPAVMQKLGEDNKRFDFVIRTSQKTYLIEANFYAGGGSKPNEVARAYSELASKINAVPGFEFVWITDGIGWKSAKTKIKEAFSHIPSVYNLTNITEFISKIKSC